MGIFHGSAIAMIGIRDWQFKAPIFVSDTLHFVMELVSKRLTNSGDRGIIDRKFSLLNQKGERTLPGIFRSGGVCILCS